MPTRYFYRGRHRKPSRATRQAAAVAVATATMSAAFTHEAAAADRWDALIECESGGNPKAQNPKSTASGLFQIIDSTWKAFGGLEFAKHAKDATVAEQYKVAERLFSAEGYGPWASSKHCWDGKVDPKKKPTAKKSDPAPVKTTPAQPPAPEAEPKVEPTVAAAPAPPPTTPPAPAAAVPAQVAQAPIGAPQLGGQTVPTIAQHTVQRGDTLWDLAGGAGWVELYERNRGVIGDNPDLIYPGQVLDL